MTWTERAECRDAPKELFFSDMDGPAWQALHYCMRCPVADECLDDAMRFNERHGIRAGMSAEYRQKHHGEIERRLLLRRERVS